MASLKDPRDCAHDDQMFVYVVDGMNNETYGRLYRCNDCGTIFDYDDNQVHLK